MTPKSLFTTAFSATETLSAHVSDLHALRLDLIARGFSIDGTASTLLARLLLHTCKWEDGATGTSFPHYEEIVASWVELPRGKLEQLVKDACEDFDDMPDDRLILIGTTEMMIWFLLTHRKMPVWHEESNVTLQDDGRGDAAGGASEVAAPEVVKRSRFAATVTDGDDDDDESNNHDTPESTPNNLAEAEFREGIALAPLSGGQRAAISSVATEAAKGMSGNETETRQPPPSPLEFSPLVSERPAPSLFAPMMRERPTPPPLPAIMMPERPILPLRPILPVTMVAIARNDMRFAIDKAIELRKFHTLSTTMARDAKMKHSHVMVVLQRAMNGCGMSDLYETFKKTLELEMREFE